MTPETAFQWAGIFSLALAIPAGLFGFIAPVFKWLRSSIFGMAGFAIASLGVVLITTPKWTEVVIKIGEWETKISTLETANKTLGNEADLARTKLASTQNLLAAARTKNMLALAGNGEVLQASWWKSRSDAVDGFANATAIELAATDQIPPGFGRSTEGLANWFGNLESEGVTFVSTQIGNTPAYVDPDDAAAKIAGRLDPDFYRALTSSNTGESQKRIADLVKMLGEEGIIVSPPIDNTIMWAQQPTPVFQDSFEPLSPDPEVKG